MLDFEDTSIDQLPLNRGVHLLSYNGLVALKNQLALSHIQMQEKVGAPYLFLTMI